MLGNGSRDFVAVKGGVKQRRRASVSNTIEQTQVTIRYNQVNRWNGAVQNLWYMPS
jgi:hypothetical protein